MATTSSDIAAVHTATPAHLAAMRVAFESALVLEEQPHPGSGSSTEVLFAKDVR